MRGFEGKVVIITGAAGAIGAATAEAFAKEGAKLAIVDKNKESLKNTAEKCRSVGCNEILEITTDLAVFENLEGVIQKTVEKFEGIDILANIAGVAQVDKIEDIDIATYEHVFRVNLTAPVFLCKYALPHLKKSKGNVVNVSSIAALRAIPEITPYGMTKIALDHFARGFAAECVEHEVLVNNVNPGFANTPFATNSGISEERSSGVQKKGLGKQPLGILDAEEIADAILHLSSTRNMTGQNLVIDRGFLVSS